MEESLLIEEYCKSAFPHSGMTIEHALKSRLGGGFILFLFCYFR